MWFLISNLILSTAWAAPQKMELLGYSQQTPVWKMELSVDKKCVFSGRYFSSSKLVSVTKEGEDCSEISSQLNEAIAEAKTLPATDRAKVETLYTGELSFVFVIDGKTYQVPFDSPRDCTIVPVTGALDCKDNKLTASQKLLILLRPSAREMKFIN
jgi:hypothetical protein